MLALARAGRCARSAIAWNDIEFLPLWAALLMGLVFLWLCVAHMTPTLHIATIKAAGIMGALALRHAWLRLDDDEMGA
ncbi:hypothetical protein [Sphingobium ummariense]|uniref:Uncharacterized protein n=1 Tax=Sphingobium ummariense RL-3 TaxID=1346791 RepID=T0K4X1_9SPHN|nr:hypothetical protein [Sphingobium ummariense]EQB31714.1 hypothetical protein M529_13115 [Sphingobium ummariense RL-3]